MTTEIGLISMFDMQNELVMAKKEAVNTLG